MTISRVLDERRITTTGENAGRFHIKIRLVRTEDKQTYRRFYKTGIFATADEFKKIMGNPGSSRELQEKQSRLNAIYEKAKGILKDNPFIDFNSFGQELLQAGSYKNPLDALAAIAQKKRDEGKIGTAEHYEQAASSFKKFCEYFSFGSVTPEWLQKYEKAMLKEGRSITTVGIYCTALRTVFNLAKQKGTIPEKLYPFGKGKYIIPSSKRRKMALTEDQKNQVLKFRSLSPEVQMAVDYFIFSYFCYGMNFKDIALLRYQDIKGDAIVFDRAKTIDTERVNKESIEVPLRSETTAIIKKYGNPEGSYYVFPILREGLAEDQIDSRVHDFIKHSNINLKVLASGIGVPKITTYWARHTFATIAWKKGGDLIFIQQALGHSDPKTTQRYLDSFDIETKKKAANWL